jgi:hypothetical protein
MPRGLSLSAYLKPALELLSRSPALEARRTLRAIRRGRVRIQLLKDLSAADLGRVRKDLGRSNLSLRTVLRSLNGYMWGDRVYVHRSLSPSQLAATLVHEVSHVLNRSEEHYQTPLDVLREEYRAYYAEQRFAGVAMTRVRCHTLKLRVIREYQLEGVAPADLPDVPVSRASRARR